MKKSLCAATMFVSVALAPVHSEAAGTKTAHPESVRAFAREIQLHFKYYESVRRTLVGWAPHEVAVACHDTQGVLLQKASMDKQKNPRDAKVGRSQTDTKAWADAHMAKELQSQGRSGRWSGQEGTP